MRMFFPIRFPHMTHPSYEESSRQREEYSSSRSGCPGQSQIQTCNHLPWTRLTAPSQVCTSRVQGRSRRHPGWLHYTRTMGCLYILRFHTWCCRAGPSVDGYNIWVVSGKQRISNSLRNNLCLIFFSHRSNRILIISFSLSLYGCCL